MHLKKQNKTHNRRQIQSSRWHQTILRRFTSTGRVRLCVSAGGRTYSVAVVADFNDEVVLAEVPHWGPATRAGWGQDVLDLSVPRHTADVLQRLSDKTTALLFFQEYTPFSFLLYDSLINVQYSKESSKTNIPVFWVLVPLESRSYSCPRYRFQTHSHLMQPGLSAAEDKIESVSTFVSDDVKLIDTGVKGTAEQLKFNSPQNISEAPEKKLLLTVHQRGGRRWWLDFNFQVNCSFNWIIPGTGWRRELSPAPCASRSQQWSHRSLQPWSLRGRTRWRCRSRLLRWERRTGELRCPFHTDPRPVCGICGRREERCVWWTAALKGNTINNNMTAAFSTCETRRSCHMTSCPETVQSSPAGKTPGRHWCWRRHPAAGLMFLQTERTGHVVSHHIRKQFLQ